MTFQREDGGIYGPEGLVKNYESSVALSLLTALKPSLAPDDPLLPKIAALQAFLKKDQWDESEGKSVDDPWYGGAGYGGGKRPDLSNTQMMLEALHDSGLPADDPVYKKALVFIQRCQMRGESNDQAFAKGATQGGFIYSPANGGESKAGEIEVDGRKELRCYGSMTYAGFKSMLYCGLSKDDPRVRAAYDWMRANWTLDFNPNMPEKQSREGLFYYYQVFARALAAWGEDTITDTHGKQHNWRAELLAKLGKLQRKDGSLMNEADRWMEGKPQLTTAYALLSLQAAYPPPPPLPPMSQPSPQPRKSK
jgi:squalene-hopene/tetraprenyl-beta-curcumene cyclase